MMESHRISNDVDHIEQDKRLRVAYGYIVDVLTVQDQEYYIPLVAPEETYFSVDTQCNYLPMEEPHAQLAANYGSPRDLIGERVRIEYYGARWRTGVARIVPGRRRRPSGNTTEVPTRGFRFAIAGGGSV